MTTFQSPLPAMRLRTLMYSMSEKKMRMMMKKKEKKKLYSTSNEYMRSAFCHENVVLPL